jgi:3',5'-cyclic AMP phosphodiesterase CpdA
MRIIQFSDTHISHLGGVGHDNAERLVDYLNEVAAPDLVVNTGDVVILDPDADDDRAAAIRIHQRIHAPLRPTGRSCCSCTSRSSSMTASGRTSR